MKTLLLLGALVVGGCFTPSLPAKDVVKCKSPDGSAAQEIIIGFNKERKASVLKVTPKDVSKE